ncbi:hypothetical protein CDL12_03424 [Handroanthus impetiginosus]|uniref:Uncharacterized protein n=1 Tax=Handroanthus impetiginosus TaxID=429701 RepID=A0A2G9I264_9LAMI|nr:hypothetical protein CDL12_03424 [Handroanthus impetiginosus]
MMNKKQISSAPIDSPTMDGMELQAKNSSLDTQNTTTTTTATAVDADPSTTTVGRVKTSVHVTALDGIANVNSLFTMATFIGFSLTVPQAATVASRPECTASQETVRRLIVYEVVSFSFFLFSSLIAQSLKLSINLFNNMDPNDPHKADIDPDFLKYGLFGSAIGSVMGSAFLLLSIVDFIQVKLGVFSCGYKPVYALVTLVLFVGSGLLVYVCTAVYASFFVEVSSKDTTQKTDQS